LDVGSNESSGTRPSIEMAALKRSSRCRTSSAVNPPREWPAIVRGQAGVSLACRVAVLLHGLEQIGGNARANRGMAERAKQRGSHLMPQRRFHEVGPIDLAGRQFDQDRFGGPIQVGPGTGDENGIGAPNEVRRARGRHSDRRAVRSCRIIRA
jgi:hypothetical protein